MTTTTLRPNATLEDPASTTGAANAHTALSDDTDASYIEKFAFSPTRVALGTFTLPAGAVVKSWTGRLRSRQNSVPDPGQTPSTLFTVATTSYTSSGTNLTFGSAFATKSTAVTAQKFTQAQLDALEVRLSYTGAYWATNDAEAYLDVVHVAKPTLVVAAVTPDPYAASSRVPLSWTNTLDSDGGAQTRYQVVVRVGTAAGVIAYDSGEVISSNTSATTVALVDGTYVAQVRVAQTVNGDSHWSDYNSSAAFVLDVPSSEVLSVVPVAVDASGKIGVTVNRDTGTAAWEFVEVERSIDAGVSWSPVRGATVVAATGDTFAVDDYEVANGAAVIYRARATYYSSGLPITGAWVGSSSTSWTGGECEEWLKDPLNPSRNLLIESVNFSDQQRSARAGVFNPLGRSDSIIVSDVLTSSVGSLTVRVTGQVEALALDELLADAGVFVLNLLPMSLFGPARNGFAYIAVLSTGEQWETQYYAGNTDGEDRLVTIPFVVTQSPGDSSAGTI